MFRKITFLLLVSSIFGLFLPANVVGQTLLTDDFAGTGFIDQTVWRLPFGGPGSFLGRTQLKTDLSVDYPVQSISSVDAATIASLRLDTFQDNGSGVSSGVFSGHEMITRRNFVVGGGLRFEARMRLDDPPEGIVGAAFLFDVSRTIGGDPVRDEIDGAELLGNEAQPGGQDRLLTNFWNDGPFGGAGSEGNPNLSSPFSGWDATQFHDYRVDWLPERIDWFVDNQLIRSAANDTPEDPMSFRINLWAPDSDFGAAYSANLQPTQSAQNQTYTLEVDRVEITQLNTERSANLLVDGSFEETGSGSLFPIFDATEVGGWFGFSNHFFEDGIARTGDYAGKNFGPFNPGTTDASGFLQNVPASPGEVFEASVFAQTTAGDSIANTSNFGTIALEFLDASGNVIGENRRESTIIQGFDPDTPVDQWVEGNVVAIAPAGTTKARVVLPFIQFGEGIVDPPNQDPGALWWDDVSLVLLTPEEMSAILGDYDNNGLVGGGDLALVLNSWGQDASVTGVPDGWINEQPTGLIGADQLSGVLNNWGNTAAPPAVPEPTGFALALLSLFGLRWARSKGSAS